MNFDELLVAIETLLVGKFKFFPIEADNLYRDVELRTIKTANGNVNIYGTARIRFEGNGNYIDNMSLPAEFVDMYDFVVKNMYIHKTRFDAKVFQLREAVETLQELNCVNARFVEEFDRINPIIRVETDGITLFTLVPKFRTIFAQFNEDSSFDEIGTAEYNGFDMRICNIAEHGRKLPSGFHVFPYDVRDGTAAFGLRAFLTPCIVTARTLTLKKAIVEEHSPHAFYAGMCSEETVNVIEYTVP